MLQGIRLWHVAPRILERAPSRKRRTMGGAIDREMCRRIAEAYEALTGKRLKSSPDSVEGVLDSDYRKLSAQIFALFFGYFKFAHLKTISTRPTWSFSAVALPEAQA